MVDEVSAAAAQGDQSENAEYIYGKNRLREIDRRTRFLEKRLDVLEVIDADAPCEKWGRNKKTGSIALTNDNDNDSIIKIQQLL